MKAKRGKRHAVYVVRDVDGEMRAKRCAVKQVSVGIPIPNIKALSRVGALKDRTLNAMIRLAIVELLRSETT